MARPSCPSCGARRPRLAARTPNRDPLTEAMVPEVAWAVCRSCGLIHQNPRVARGLMESLHRRLADKAEGGSTDKASRTQAASRLAALKRLAPCGGRVLEAGCSDGAFLEAARRAGYDCVGVEPSAASLRRARRLHPRLDVRRGTLETYRGNERFDAVCAFYVLEYSFEPRRFLRAARRLLNPGGVLLLEVPDMNRLPGLSLATPLLTYQDIVVFTRPTLRRLLRLERFAAVALPASAAVPSKPYGMRLAARPSDASARLEPNQYRAGLRLLERTFSSRGRAKSGLQTRVARLLAGARPRTAPVVIFGAGENGRMVAAASPAAGRRLFFCDNNAALHGRRVDGLEVVAPAKVPSLKPALVIAASAEYSSDMARQMRALGVPARCLASIYGGLS